MMSRTIGGGGEVVSQKRAGYRAARPLDVWDELTTLHLGGLAATFDHFRGSSLNPNWSWAGAPFATPATVSVAGSILNVSNFGPGRAFLWTPYVTSSATWLASVALYSAVTDHCAGVRLDDGTDNNYVEAVLKVNSTTPVDWLMQFRRRAGGGLVVATSGNVLTAPLNYVVRLYLSGTLWSSWNVTPLLQVGMGQSGLMPIAGTTGLTWTPTRAGLIFDASTTASTWQTFYVDFVRLG